MKLKITFILIVVSVICGCIHTFIETYAFKIYAKLFNAAEYSYTLLEGQ